MGLSYLNLAVWEFCCGLSRSECQTAKSAELLTSLVTLGIAETVVLGTHATQ